MNDLTRRELFKRVGVAAAVSVVGLPVAYAIPKEAVYTGKIAPSPHPDVLHIGDVVTSDEFTPIRVAKLGDHVIGVWHGNDRGLYGDE